MIDLNEDEEQKLAEIMNYLDQDPKFAELSDDRKDSIRNAWVGFVIARTSEDVPDWGTVINLISASFSDEEAEIFFRALEKIP
jgi:hypothetical protein